DANDDFVTIEAGSTETIPVLADDTAGSSDLDPASLAITLDPARGLATTEGDGTLTYSPESGNVGIDRFGYEVCDVEGLCSSATVTDEVVACVLDESWVTSSGVVAESGPPGETIVLRHELNADRVDACFAQPPMVRFMLGGGLLAGPVSVGGDGVVEATAELPDSVE